MPWGRRGFGKVDSICLQCGRPFKVYHAHQEFNPNRGKFCSVSCKAQWQRTNIHGANHPCWKDVHVKKSCPICGEEFEIRRSEMKRGRGNYCSKECLYRATRLRLIYDNPVLRPEVRLKIKQIWQNPEYKERTIRSILKGLLRRPTVLERDMISLIEKGKLSYKYTGDGSFLIGFCCPDFINTDGEKICLEVANRFHHPAPWAEKRIAHFAKYGWKCYIFFSEGGYLLNENKVFSTLRGA